MYGTVARLQAKQGAEQQLMELTQDPEYHRIEGLVSTYVFKADNSPDEYFLVAIFESKEAYWANANSPEQDARYRQLRDLLAADPEWHDGQLVYPNE